MNNPTPIEITGIGIELTGTIKEVDVFETPPTIVTSVIPVASSWGVKVKWEVNGPSGNPHSVLLANVNGTGMVWQVTVYLEGLGPTAPEFAFTGAGGVDFRANYGFTVGPIPGPTSTADPRTRTWERECGIPAGTVPIGLYKLAVALQLFTPAAGGMLGAPLPVVGYWEGSLVQIY